MKNCSVVIVSLGLLLTAVVPLTANAQSTWPTAAVRVLVANSPGTATDLAARVYSDNLSRVVGMSVVVENRPGADGYIAAEQVARSTPDGHTLFFASQSIFGIDPHARKSMPVDPEKDFTPIAVMVDDTGPTGLYATPSAPFATFAELVAYGKANPGKLSFGSIVPLFSMIGAWINKRAGIDMLEVKYKVATQAVQDVLAGRIPLLLNAFGSMEAHLRAGKLRVIAVTQRLEDYPQFQTLTNIYPDYKQPAFVVLVGPARMPAGLAERINKASASVVENPKFNQDLASLRWRNAAGAQTPQGTAELMRRARLEWGVFIKEAGITPE